MRTSVRDSPVRRVAGTVCVIGMGSALGAEIYSKPAAQDFPTNVYWGDTHLHTNMSVDANGMGNHLLSPDDAYRFAKGETVRAHNGQQVRLARPLDFLVVSDHAVNLGVMPRMQARDPILLATEVGRKWREIWDEAEWSPDAALNADSMEEWRSASRAFGVGSGGQQSFFWAAWSSDYVADEVYATTGPRIIVRFFGGFEFEASDADRAGLAATGYAKGVPMGGDLTAAPAPRPPRFLIRAVKDPDGANLDRIQIVKGWRDRGGNAHERVYDVALADGRKPTLRGDADPVGNTVNGATYDNSIGDPELAVVWFDPDFDRDAHAFYYVRVLQIPTPRWTAYDAAFYGLAEVPEHAPMAIQERAYTSPIWYTPH